MRSPIWVLLMALAGQVPHFLLHHQLHQGQPRLAQQGHSRFNELLFRRGVPRFCAFEVLHLNGEDLRTLPLLERKKALRKIVPRDSHFLLSIDHIEEHGEQLFGLACERDLEGIVAKHRQSLYSTGDHKSGLGKNQESPLLADRRQG